LRLEQLSRKRKGVTRGNKRVFFSALSMSPFFDHLNPALQALICFGHCFLASSFNIE
jgi:hypothetical protein